MSNFPHIGEWWVPGESERIYGTLTFSDENGLLLEGIASAERFCETREVPHILGISGSGLRITLIQCFCYGWTNRGVTNFRCHADLAMIGDHLIQDHFSFRRATIDYSRLRKWAASSYFRDGRTTENQSELAFLYTFPEPLFAEVRKGKLVIKHELSWKGGNNDPLHLTPRAYLEVTADDELTVDEWTAKFIRPFQHFLTLATGKPVGVTAFTAFGEESAEHQSQIQIVSSTFRRGERADPGEDGFSRDALFSRYPLGDDWGEVVAAWFELSDELGSTLDAFFTLSYNESMYLEHRFLTLVQVAESYSLVRRKLLPPFSKQEFEQRVAEAMEFVPEHLRAWLKPRISPYIRSPSLGDRIKDLTAHALPVVGPLIPDVEQFGQEVSGKRNLLTHRSHNRTAQHDELMSIHDLTFRLLTILRVCFLSEIGIPVEQTAHFYNHNFRYKDEVKAARQQSP